MNLDKLKPPKSPEEIVAFIDAVLADTETFNLEDKLTLITGFVAGMSFAAFKIMNDDRDAVLAEMIGRFAQLEILIDEAKKNS